VNVQSFKYFICFKRRFSVIPAPFCIVGRKFIKILIFKAGCVYRRGF